jgi:hypothetical protein
VLFIQYMQIFENYCSETSKNQIPMGLRTGGTRYRGAESETMWNQEKQCRPRSRSIGSFQGQRAIVLSVKSRNYLFSRVNRISSDQSACPVCMLT